MVRLGAFTGRAWVQSLVEELRSCMPGCATKREKEVALCGLTVTASTEGSRPGKTGGEGFEFEQKRYSEVKSLSRVRLFATPWTVAFQAPLSMGFSRQ